MTTKMLFNIAYSFAKAAGQEVARIDIQRHENKTYGTLWYHADLTLANGKEYLIRQDGTFEER